MSFSSNTTIELVSEDGPIEFNVMMREGVKALTKILTDHLQDHPDFLDQQSMKLVFKDDGGKLQPVITAKNSTNEGNNNNDDYDKDSDDNGTENNVRTSSHEVSNFSSDTSLTIPSIEVNIGDYSGNDTIDDDGDDDEIDSAEHIFHDDNVESRRSSKTKSSRVEEILFDYEENGLSSLSGDFSHDIQKMISSSLSNSASQKTTTGKRSLHKTSHTCDKEAGSHQKVSQDQHQEIDEVKSHSHSGICATGHHHGDFNYSHNPKSKPDFGSLAAYNKPLCMFCEYYFVFGEAPKNMIKWYYRTHGRDASQCPSYSEEKTGGHN